jgi:cysteine desulfurase
VKRVHLDRRVHLDHNATTPMRPEVRALFLERLDQLAGNPSSVHRAGREARQWLDEARERIAASLEVHEDEIVFTSGGTESDNLAILGAVRAEPRERGFLTTAVEHSAVLGAADRLAAEGRTVERFPVDATASVDIERFAARAREPWVALVSAMAANNEVGTLLPLAELGAALGRSEGGAKRPGTARPLFHTDAVQALGRIPVQLRAWGVDLASFSAHKIGGPLGVGVLYKQKGVALEGLIFGGGQEHGLRPGTENVPAIAAAALAIELAVREQADFAQRTSALCRSFWQQLQVVVPGVVLHGPPLDAQQRLPNTLNLELPSGDGARVDSRVLVPRLDLEGLEVSAGSACASGSLEPSHVLLAMGLSNERARGGLRVSLGRTSSAEDVHIAVDILGRTFRSRR